MTNPDSHSKCDAHHANCGEKLIKALNWRYATKAFDALKKLSSEQWNTLEHALVLSASSYGLQPWKFINVVDPKIRAELKAASWNQGQITDASHLVVFAAKVKVEAKDIEDFVDFTAKIRSVPVGNLAQYKIMMLEGLSDMTHEWCARQCYIALGNLLTSAAVLGIDACPMEGFDPAAYDKILGLSAIGYKSVVIATLGYRSAGDKYADLKKVRYPASQVVLQK